MPTKLEVDDPRDIQGASERRFQPLVNSENSSDMNYGKEGIDAGADQAEALANDPTNASRDASDGESRGAGDDADWRINRDNVNPRESGKSKKGWKIFARKGGPPIVLITMVLGGGGVIGLFSGAGTLLVNLSEVFTNKFDYQTSTVEMRNNKIISSKLADTTTGKCGLVKFACRFSTFSNKELAAFKSAGIDVEMGGKTGVTGRYRIKSLAFNGETITAKSFSKSLSKNAAFANAMHTAYNMRFQTKWDKVWTAVKTKLKISKKAPFDETTDRSKQIVEETANGRNTSLEDAPADCTGECTDAEKKQNAEANKRAGQTANDLANTSEGSTHGSTGLLNEIQASDSTKPIGIPSEVNAGKIMSKSALGFLKITGPLDDACMVWSLANTVSSVAKSVRMYQMARYAMVFLTTASMIKAGDAQPDDVAYLGNVLTKVTQDADGKQSKPATDSFGYRYAAFGNSGIDTMASNAVAGASFGGKIEAALAGILVLIGGRSMYKKTCKALSNPIVQIGALLVGTVTLIFTGGASTAFKAATTLTVMLVAPFLAAYIGEMLAGKLVDADTYGETSGNFIASGTGGILSQSANYGGGSIMNDNQATQFLAMNRQVQLSYAAYDRSTLSPFDASSPNTFLGSIFTSFAPYMYSSSTPMAAIRNLGSIIFASAKNFITPTASAADSLGECKDPTIQELGIAADPFCNPIIGIPPKYMNVSPIDAFNDLYSSNFVDEDGNPTDIGDFAGTGISYKKFTEQCMQRDDPYGLEDPSGDNTDSKNCFIDSQSKANGYVHFVDMRVADINDSPVGDPTGTDLSGTGNINGSTASTDGSSIPSFCTSQPAPTGKELIACKGYQFSGYGYLYGGHHDDDPTTFMTDFHAGKYSLGTPILDCSSFVRMAIFDAIGLDIGSIDTASMPTNSNLREIPISEARAGDLVWKVGHTEVVVSNDTTGQKVSTVGAHTDTAPIEKQIGPDSQSYSYYAKAYQVIQ